MLLAILITSCLVSCHTRLSKMPPRLKRLSISQIIIWTAAIYIISAECRPREAPPPGAAAEPFPPSRGTSGGGSFDFYRNLMREEPKPNSRARTSEAEDEEVCRPDPNPINAQYLVGYGSLMQHASKSRTAPDTGPSVPVLIRGFSREWNTRGVSIGLSTTYLGVVKDDRTDGNRNISSFNAVVFKLPVTVHTLHQTLKSYDEREEFYCRQKVPNANVVSLLKNSDDNGGGSRIEPNADFWIYVNKPIFTAPPSAKYPIVQSYVDVFISGCLELESDHQLPNFTDFCISSTKGWTPEWVNDRIYPRRPFLYQPQAPKIDKAIAKNLPNIFDNIVVEG